MKEKFNQHMREALEELLLDLDAGEITALCYVAAFKDRKIQKYICKPGKVGTAPIVGVLEEVKFELVQCELNAEKLQDVEK